MGAPQDGCCMLLSRSYPGEDVGHPPAQGYTSAFQTVRKGEAAGLVREIMSNPARVVRGSVTTDVYNAAGQGVRFQNGTNKFIGFLEASKATR